MASPATTDSLAVNGGPKVRSTPMPLRRLFGQEEKKAAMDLFDWCIEKGDAFGYQAEQENGYCQEFVKFLTGKADGGYADMVNSGSVALYVALRAVNPAPFTEIIVPPVTDPGGMMPVPLINCIPVVADAEPGSYNVGVDQIAARITDRTSAIVVAHIMGIPCDMDPIMKLARSKGIPVIEDCAQAHGATYKGRKVGTIGDIAAFSTMFGKHHATGGQGGVVFTTSEDLHWKGRRAADRGKPFNMTHDGNTVMATNFSNVIASLNLNQDEMGAAIGRAQLKKLPGFVATRRRNARGVEAGTRHLKAVHPVIDPSFGENAFWYLFIDLDLNKLTCTKDQFVDAIKAEGIPCNNQYWCNPQEMMWYQNKAVYGEKSGMPWDNAAYAGDYVAAHAIPNALATRAKRIIISPFHENFGEQEVKDICAALDKVENAFLK